MKVLIRLFAGLRERAGADHVELELPEEARVGDALEQLREITGGLPVVMAINQEYATAEAVLRAGDELALIPPVSGGSGEVAPGSSTAVTAGDPAITTGDPRAYVKVIDGPIALDPLRERVRSPAAGAVVIFEGVTREVDELQYEAYVEMAERQMRSIVERAIETHGLCAAAVEHRTGTVVRTEASIVIAVSAPHRGEAFAGGREIIDRIKELAPIWKQEEGEWVAGHTPGDAPGVPPSAA